MKSLPFSGADRLAACASLSLGLVIACASSAFAEDAPAAAAVAVQTVNKGDTAWLLISSALVLMMSVPGLALFYGGLVRSKNMLSILSQVFMIVSLVGVVWVLYGYSLAFGDGGTWNPYIGGMGKAFMRIAPEGKAITDAVWPTFTPTVYVPELAYMVFQMTFAMITPALIVGAFAERMKFSAVLLFVLVWVTVIYFPIAHWVWGTATPDDVVAAAKALAAAGADEVAKKAAQAKLDGITGVAGWLAAGSASWMGGTGALDFAGGTVVHINAGIAGLVGALVLGKRIGYPRESMAPHSLTMTMIGASLLWVGWFGFNAGSNLEATGTTALAFVNTMVATAAASLSWLFVEWAIKGKPSLLGMVSGAVAGLVAITPASGYAGPMGAVVLGLMVSPVCYFFVATVKNALGYDDALDVFGIHCIGGITGALMTGILVNPALGGVGITDYAAKDFIGTYSMSGQMIAQITAVVATLLWSGIGSFILYKIVDLVVGLRVSSDSEREGLDVAEHGERAYNY